MMLIVKDRKPRTYHWNGHWVNVGTPYEDWFFESKVLELPVNQNNRKKYTVSVKVIERNKRAAFAAGVSSMNRRLKREGNIRV